MYDILLVHPIPTSYRYSSTSISNGIKLVAKSGKCLYNTQYRQNPWWGHTGTASTSHAAYRIDNRIIVHAATHMEMLWESILEATNGINVLSETSCSKVQERESKCKGGSALKCSSIQHIEQHFPEGHIRFSTYFVTKSHIENYIDRAGIPTARKHKSSKSSYTSSSITLPELSIKLLEIHTTFVICDTLELFK